jgi:hypothetical protein
MSCLRILPTPDCPRAGSEARKEVEANPHRQSRKTRARALSGTFTRARALSRHPHHGRRGRVSMFGTTFASPRSAAAVGREPRRDPLRRIARTRGAGHACVALSGGDAKSAASHRHAGSPACEVRASSKANARNASAPFWVLAVFVRCSEPCVVPAVKVDSVSACLRRAGSPTCRIPRARSEGCVPNFNLRDLACFGNCSFSAQASG